MDLRLKYTLGHKYQSVLYLLLWIAHKIIEYTWCPLQWEIQDVQTGARGKTMDTWITTEIVVREKTQYKQQKINDGLSAYSAKCFHLFLEQIYFCTMFYR